MAPVAATIEELEKLSEFRAIVGKIYPESDEKLLPWLRARDLDLVKAEQMLRRHIIWRRNNEIDALKTWRSPVVLYPYMQFGFDKANCPIFMLPVGRWDIRSTIESGDMALSLRFVYQALETVVSTAHKAGNSQGIIILDFDGFTYRQIAHRTVLQGFLEVIRVFDANYPELLKSCYVINAPKIFNALFTLIKPVLNSRTLVKIHIFGPNKPKWQEALLKHTESDQLPPFWGGTRPGRDEFCSDDWFMEPLPPNFFKRGSTNVDEFGEEWATIKVPAREKVLFEYVVKAGENSVLKWVFKTDGYDIGFSIYFGEEEDFPVQYQRVNSHEEQEEGFLNLEKPGTYTLEFDNSYSRTRAKTLHYSIGMSES
ncbi:unnamed protein product [Allacma fusca]|uniref:Uncharacterized protein n=1 Tax=Allacma fusca TaxID=39272 RepID=A0A8J2P4C1_9HEXA|nr:unnamed protein product [Allacma fusca]